MLSQARHDAEVADEYAWLDEERRGHEVYANEVHPVCVCHWDLDVRLPDEPPSGLPAMRLVARRKGCVIHGAKGWL